MSLGPALTMMLLLGNAPPAGFSLHEQDRHRLTPWRDPLRELHDVWIGPELAAPADQTQTERECPRQQRSLTLEAFLRMAADGAFSVWDITRSIASSSEVKALRGFIGYHSINPRVPSRTHLLLQVELTLSPTGESQQVTKAQLAAFRTTYTLQVRQEPACAGEELRLLLEGTVDIHKLQSVPHELTLSVGAGASVKLATLKNIMVR